MKNGHKLYLVHLARRIETSSNQSGQFHTVRGAAFCRFFATLSTVFFPVVRFLHVAKEEKLKVI
jgi:hypothetical protein